MPTELNRTDKYILDAIRKWVWSGFYSADDVNGMIDDILEEDANEQMLRAAVAPEFAKKREAEQGWPAVTDCDRLDVVFTALANRGVLCLHNAGYTMSDGHSDSFEALSEQPKGRYFGYCFYHGQDVERAIDGQHLMLAFDHIEVVCSPKSDPGGMRVFVAPKAKEILDEGQEAHAGADHRQAA